MIKERPKCIIQNCKLLEKKHWRKSSWCENGQWFFGYDTKCTDNKYTNKWDCIKLKNFRSKKETINKINRQLTKWGKIFAYHILDKGLISRMCKEQLQSIVEINNPIKKWAKDLNKHLSKEDTQTAYKHMKIYSASLIIREIQVKIEWDPHIH